MGPVKFLSQDLYADCPELFDEFVDLANEQFRSIEIQLVALEKDFQDYEAIDAVMRLFHSIKGAALNLELEDLGGLVHAAEDLMDLVRSKKILLDNKATDLFFEVIDVAKLHLEDIQQATENEAQLHGVDAHEDLLNRLRAIS